MGKSNTAVKQWLSDTKRFADFCNGILYGGRPVIKPQELEAIDGESDIIITDKNGKEKSVQRFRDIVMRWKKHAEFVILACENQDRIHYAMPVRNMLYDSLSYISQMKQIWKGHEKEPNKVTNEEFLSRFKKDDKLKPVITIVFYYGEKPWDGSHDIHNMIETNDNLEKDKIIKSFIPNYKINLVDIARLENTQVFPVNLQLIFDMLKYRNQKDLLVQYVKDHREYFANLDQETYHAAGAFLNSEKQLQNVVSLEKEGDVIDMCKALDDLYKEGVGYGMERGIERGIEYGEDCFAALTDKLLRDSRSNDLLKAVSDKAFRNILYKEYGIEKK